MAYVTPQTHIYLYKDIPLQPNYEHTFYFDSKSNQDDYFESKHTTALTYAPTTYQNITAGVIRVGINIKTVYNVNYLSFTNSETNAETGYEKKTYYCFVTNVVYINENTTEIHYTVDVMQTYLFQYTLLKEGVRALDGTMFIERTHIKKSDDTKTHSTMFIDEGIDLGMDMIPTKVIYNALGDSGVSAVLYYTGLMKYAGLGTVKNYDQTEWGSYNPPPMTPIFGYAKNDSTIPGESFIVPDTNWFFYKEKYHGTWGSYDNVFYYTNKYDSGVQPDKIKQPLTYFTTQVMYSNGNIIDGGDFWTGSIDNVPQFNGFVGLLQFINGLNTLGKSDCIVSLRLVPTLLLNGGVNFSNNDKEYVITSDSQSETGYSVWQTGFTTSEMTTYDTGDYTPKNFKLNVYPYNYIVVDSNDGNSKIYKPQYMNDYIFKAKKNVFSGTVVLFPTGMKGYTKDKNNNDIVVSTLGVSKNISANIPFVTDQYKNWMANNTVARYVSNLNFATESVKSATGIAFSGNNSGFQAGSAPIKGKKESQASFDNRVTQYNTGLSQSIGLMKQNHFENKASSLIDLGVSNLSRVTDKIMEVSNARMLPAQLSGNIDDLLSYCSKCYGYNIYRMSVSKTVRQRIDNYFSVYGYKINNWVHNPKLKIRSNWTYIKTASCSIIGMNIPKDFSSAINQIFDNGITFWTSPSNIENYSTFDNPDPS